MAEPLPAALKIPEIRRFINRANQLRTFKPAIAYWCEYHAVNQIVGKSLHTTDDECFNFTKTLIERLEATKAEHAEDDSIVDNVAGQAYVEQFAQGTFDRAERTMRAGKVTRQTADTFDAAATFFDLTHEWGAPDAETLQKIKFAKWNAARILKAIREGKDPNESNPRQADPEAEPTESDAELEQLVNQPPQSASVEDVPDAGEPPHPPPQTHESYFPSPPEQPHPEPFVPSPLSQSPAPPTVPFGRPPSPGYQVPPQPSPQIPTKLPSQFAPPPPPQPSDVNPDVPPSWTSNVPDIPPPSSFQHAAPMPPPSAPTPMRIAPVAPPPAAPVSYPVEPVGGFTTDQKDINQAQKHAKFAISALNFDDVSTAVKELQNALAALGAR